MEMNRSHAASVHLPRHLTEPHHVRPHRSFAASEAGSLDGQVLAPRRTRAAGCAKSTRQLAMHMDEIARACDLVQRVYILRDGKHVASMIPLEPRQRRMRRIGPRIAMPSPAEIVEVVQTHWVAGEAFRLRHLLERDLRPPSTFVAEVPSPLSADRPAPVRMTMLWKAATAPRASLSMGTGLPSLAARWAERLVLRG
jgi:hypothetical protein